MQLTFAREFLRRTLHYMYIGIYIILMHMTPSLRWLALRVENKIMEST